MSAPQQTIGTGLTVTTAGVVGGFVAKAIPFLQFASLTMGLIAATLTVIYTYQRLKAKKFD